MSVSLTLKNISRSYIKDNEKFFAVQNVNLEVKPGEFLTFLGPSGCGKTTTLRMIAGFETPTEGQILLGDKDVTKIPANERGMGFVFQNYALFPHMKIFDNVAYGLRIRKESSDLITQKVKEALAMVGLEKAEHRYPNQLSGGEQQRVSLARALVNNPKVIIADEPTGNVDPEMSHEIVGLLTKINNAGTTVIMVTHEHDLVRSFQRRVIVIKNGEVVSDTPDPTHAQFTGENPKADTDMFFFDEDVEIDDVNVLPKDDEEDVFDNLENVVSEEENQGGEQ